MFPLLQIHLQVVLFTAVVLMSSIFVGKKNRCSVTLKIKQNTKSLVTVFVKLKRYKKKRGPYESILLTL